VRTGRHDHERSTIGLEDRAGVETFDPVSPQVDQDLTLEAVCLDDAPYLEHGALGGAHD
jgi:hypothetical protein